MSNRWCEHCGKKFRKGQHWGAFFPYGGKHGRKGRQYICISCRNDDWTFGPDGIIRNLRLEKAEKMIAEGMSPLDALFQA